MITKKDVEYVAGLARLEFDEQQKDGFTRTLNDILEYAKKLNEVNTDGVEPTAHILDVRNVFREDSVAPSMDRQSTVSPVHRGCFRVPKVISDP